MAGLNKPYAESCEQNRGPILSVIKPLLASCKSVLEIGSGTGQHAVFFSKALQHLHWQPSDQKEYLQGIRLWIDDSKLGNVGLPIELDVIQEQWPPVKADAVFSANTLHIMPWEAVQAFFCKIPAVLSKEGKLLIYGPFNYNNKYTSDSNARFDNWLKNRDPQSGLRDFKEVDKLAVSAGFRLIEDFEMPVNNRILYWEVMK